MNECILKLSELNKIYNEIPTLQDVSISIEKGKIYGFIGQNGAGRTTLMRIITGLAYPSSGNIELFETSSKKGIENGRKRIVGIGLAALKQQIPRNMIYDIRGGEK